jgi:hypothetical protein
LAEAKNVVFATDEATVHLLLSPDPVDNGFGEEVYSVESQVLLPGQFVDQSAVPPYLINKIKEGTAFGLELMPEKKAKEVSAKAAEIRAIASSGSAVNTQGLPSESDANKESFKLASEAVENNKSE